MRIKIFSDFCSSEQAMHNYANVWLGSNLAYTLRSAAAAGTGTGTDREFELTCDDNYTHAIILNRAMPNLTVPKERVLGISFEPLEILKPSNDMIEYVKRNVGTYIIGSTKNDEYDLPPPFTCHFTYQWFDQEYNNYMAIKKSLTNSQDTHSATSSATATHSACSTVTATRYPKKGLMSIWCSKKGSMFGHRYRHELIHEILKLDPVKYPVDVWGYGCELHNSMNTGDPRLKGAFNNEEPYKDYRFCISIENTQSTDYATEKYMNCLAFNTIPVYYGATNLSMYFGERNCIRLTGDIRMDLAVIKNICEQSEGQYPEEYSSTGYSTQVDLVRCRQELFEGSAYFPNFVFEIFRE